MSRQAPIDNLEANVDDQEPAASMHACRTLEGSRFRIVQGLKPGMGATKINLNAGKGKHIQFKTSHCSATSPLMGAQRRADEL